MEDLRYVLGAPRSEAENLRWMLDRLLGNSRGARQVIVKVTGFAGGAGGAAAMIEYDARQKRVDVDPEVPIETEHGEIVETAEQMRLLKLRWSLAPRPRQVGDRRAVHVVFSMPPDAGARPEDVKAAARATLAAHLGDRARYTLALHHESERSGEPAHPHVHATIDCWGKDGRVVQHDRDTLAAWRHTFAHEMRVRGIEAESMRSFAVGRPMREAMGRIHRELRAHPGLEVYADAAAVLTRGKPAPESADRVRAAQQQALEHSMSR